MSVESEEKALLLERASSAAQRAFSYSQSSRGSSRGGRGRGRGRGGRGYGGRSQISRLAKDSNPSTSETTAEGPSGEKRKRAVEPDGSADTGVRGQGVPTIQSAKKAKTEDGNAVSAES